MTINDRDILTCKKQQELISIAVGKLEIRTKKERNQSLKKITILSEALTYIRKFAGEFVVISYSGNHSVEDLKNFAADVVMLKQLGANPIIVHGGDWQVDNMLTKLNINSPFIEGRRVSNSDSIEVIEMVLSGLVNKNIVKEIINAGGSALGICGKDGNLIAAKKLVSTKKSSGSNVEEIINYGFAGEVSKINVEFLAAFEDSEIIPVISPIAIGENGETFDLNPDEVAAKIASAVSAAKLIIVDNFDGITLPNQQLVSYLSYTTAKQIINDNLIEDNILPKIKSCILALENSVISTHIINSKTKHALLAEIFTDDGIGTMIT